MRSSPGFTLVEVVVVLTVVAALVGLLVPLGAEILESRRADAARDQLLGLRQSIVGTAPSPGGEGTGARTSSREMRVDPETFGFNGDLGALPDSLPQLIDRAALPSYEVHEDHGFGVGWRGPYLDAGPRSGEPEPFLDPFGRPVRYDRSRTVVDGDSAVATLTSRGPDRTLGTSDDLVVPLLKGQVETALTGFLVHGSGQPIVDAPVTYVFRADGSLDTAVVFTGGAGEYSVGRLHALGPVRVRSGAAGADTLAFVKKSAAAVGDSLDDVRFQAANVTAGPTTLTALALGDRTTAGICFRDAFVGGVDVKAGTGTVCPGESFSFSRPVTVEGGAAFASSAADRQFLLTGGQQTAPELRVAGAGARGDAAVQLLDWEKASTGDTVDMRGKTIETITSSGDSLLFTVPQ